MLSDNGADVTPEAGDVTQGQGYPTVEARWFYPGPVPATVRAWFEGRGRESLAQPARVDRYLRLPGQEDLGVKLREGRIEVKRREEQHGAWPFAGRAGGHVETWRKWSFALEAGPAAVAAYARPAGDWIEVEKERRLCHYRQGGAVCVLELAQVQVAAHERAGAHEWAGAQDRAAWTLAYEAWGQGDLRRALLAAACLTLGEPDAPALEAAASYGYPRWLLDFGSLD